MSIVGPDWVYKPDSFDIYKQQAAIARKDRIRVGLGEAAQQERPMVADIRIEKIENGYLVVYRKTGVSEKRKFARDMNDVGEVTKQACIELELTGAR